MKTITIDSMMKISNVPTKFNFDKERNKKTSIPLSKLINNLKDNIFYCNWEGGYLDTEENILYICKVAKLKIVCKDYVRMFIILEKK